MVEERTGHWRVGRTELVPSLSAGDAAGARLHPETRNPSANQMGGSPAAGSLSPVYFAVLL